MHSISAALRRQIYDLDLPESRWIEGICRALIDAMELRFGVLVREVNVDEQGLTSDMTWGVDLPFDAEQFTALVLSRDPDDERRAVYDAQPTVTTSLELLERGLLPRSGPFGTEFAGRHGVRDFVILTASDQRGGRILLAVPSEEPIHLCRSERHRWAKIATHLAAARRLRIGFGGHRVEAAPLVGETQLDGPALWRGMLDGRWQIVESFDAHGLRVLMARHHRGDRSSRRLTERERRVISYASLGYSNKLIAYHLDLSSSTVASHLKNSLAKLHVPSRIDLIQLVSQLICEDDVRRMHEEPAAPPEEVDFDRLEAALAVCARELARLVEQNGQGDGVRERKIRELRNTLSALQRLLPETG